MTAKAVLTCRPNSHPFQERTLILDQPAKIGRSVARARPNGSNAIFDCKVLSRNHALLWHENGKFFLQDTKSSNGTFVNNQRLSKSSEESAPREVCSGDIIQFGVDVMEVNKKLTHGCIVANVQLFLPDGKEAKASSSTTLPEKASNTPLQDVYLLNQYIKEAIQKEQMLEHKLAAVTKLVLATKDSTGSSWNAMIEEDRLLTRIDILERQIETSHKTMTDEKLREEVTQLYDDKEKYQTVAKEALRKSMQEKMDVLQKYQELEKNVQNYLREKELHKELSDRRGEELQELADKYEKSDEKSKELEDEIAALTLKYKEEKDELNKKLQEGEDLLKEKQIVLDALIVKMDVKVARAILEAHNDNTKIILPENDSNKLIEEENALTQESLDDTNKHESSANNKTGEIESMKVQLQTAEKEKKEIHSRLLHVLILFEDLKALSNKQQASEYLSELIGKVDTEIYQIKNFIHEEESLKNNYNITEKMNEINTENHVNRLNSEGAHEIEKLLEESRETIKALHTENASAKHKYDIIQEKYSLCTTDLERYKKQMEAVSESNSELKSQVAFLQDKFSAVDKHDEEYLIKLKTQSELIEAKDKLITSLQDEVSALRESTTSFRLNDLKAVKPEVACQTFKESLAIDTFDSPVSSASCLNKSSLSESDSAELMEKLLATEEELAVYKNRFSESSEECVKLTRECVQLRLDHDTSKHSNMTMLRYLIPIVILILAVLIVFHPSS